MFCGSCGKEIKEGAGFCPYCGKKLGENSAGQVQASDLEITQGVPEKVNTPKDAPEKVNVSKPKRTKSKIWIPIILVVCLVTGYFGYQKIVKDTIASEMNKYFAMVQNGVDSETAYQVLESAVPQFVGNEMISNFILESVSGEDIEDVMDIYSAMMRYMDYAIIDVKRVERNHYQATVQITNLNNKLVAARAVEIFKERYNTGLLGKASQFLNDLSADKSQLIAEVMTQSADDYYGTGDGSYFISGEYAIDIVNNNGEWVPSLDLVSIAYGCLGLN